MILKNGDCVAAVSLSWGGAGDPDICWRYDAGVDYIKANLGLTVIPMTHTLNGSEYLYNNPQARAQDLMDAYNDPQIKAIIACIGGDDSIRMLPYIDYDVIRNNPKPFIGYSDSTITHLISYKAGVQSFYGPSILAEFAENGGMFSYSQKAFSRALMSDAMIGNVAPSEGWTSERVEWLETNKNIIKVLNPHEGYDCVQGQGKTTGHLLGGCVEVLNTAKGTDIFPSLRDFNESILFLETSELMSPPWYLEDFLRSLGIMGVLHQLAGLLFGKPYDNVHYQAYRDTIQKVLAEFNCETLPVIMNVNFGHTEPMICIPYGAFATLDLDDGSIVIDNRMSIFSQ
ncbi:S66 peptidase family protein [Erysipelothrix sp. HDW6C]|uniref:S66 family peptidase n=1 Tax=Erysipelothrix sp. HDW6C TaxID=2714930 RepID=UPI00196A8269|nr:S66 peptidase family protein [Erysipelothrix sp. HDW6C]